MRSFYDESIHCLVQVPGDEMRTITGLLLVTSLAFGSGCARSDWIDRTLVTVDVTGTWSGSIIRGGTGGAGGVHDVLFELKQEGSTVKGLVQVIPRGQAPVNIEGTVAGDVFRFKDARGSREGELTVSGDEMFGRMSIAGSVSQISLRRIDSGARSPAQPR